MMLCRLDDRDVGRRGPRDHVARVLLVPWRVGNDEFARRRGEVAIGHVDGDALLPLGFQPVGQHREIDPVARHALMLGARDRVQLVGEHALAVIQQAADQRGLAVVDGARRDQAQHAVAGAGKKRVIQCVHK
ncbi:hypothetical protein G6F24_016823 [Rhizopus arrhizus]|nr:hypothetical protein G6F24_016823 [Rhizopus arrhizus]